MAEDVTSPTRSMPDYGFATGPDRSRLLRRRTSTFDRPEGSAASPITRNRRRSSLISDLSLDEARQSLRASTDDILLPKATKTNVIGDAQSSHWDSAPLIFALVPAIGGLFFKNGSAVLTDVILLVLAAIFLNWSVRVPWDWYHSAQSVEILAPEDVSPGLGTVLEEDSETEEVEQTPSPLDESAASSKELPKKDAGEKPSKSDTAERDTAASELRLHELLALASCFLGPLAGAYLLHQIRGQLSRPSEGLVSNYNLTIFLLASEIRPLAHLVKLVQARTLHLQRTLHENSYQRAESGEVPDVTELSRRIEEIETQVSASISPEASEKDNETISQKTSAQVTTDVRRTLQPDLDALNRAVRRYEKRATLQTMQTEARLQDLEGRLQDALALAAAAAQTSQRKNPLNILFEWVAIVVLLPFQLIWNVLRIPIRMLAIVFRRTKLSILGKGGREKKGQRSRSHGRIGGDRLQGRALRKS